MKKRILVFLLCSFLLFTFGASAKETCCDDMNIRSFETQTSDKIRAIHNYYDYYEDKYYTCEYYFIEYEVEEKCTNCGAVHDTYTINKEYGHDYDCE